MPNDPPPPRIAYRLPIRVLSALLRVLLDDRPIVVAGVAGFREHFQPTFWIIVKFRRQHPAFEKLFLLGRQIRVNLHEGTAIAEPLDLAHRDDGARPRKIMDGVERDNAVERAVRKRQLLRGAEMKPAYRLGGAMHQRVERDIETEGFEAGTGRQQRLDQKAFAATDVEDAHAGFETEMRDDVARHRMPAAVIAITAVTVFARSIPVRFPILLGDRDD